MPTRSDRRRRERASKRASGPTGRTIVLRPIELLIAAVVAGALLAGFLAFVLLGGGGDEGDEQAASTSAPSPLTATTPDEIAVEALARQAVESLPRGEWPELYDSFTADFQQRCPREQFVAAGEADAQAQGNALPLIRFVRMEDVVIGGDTANGIIVGEITGQTQYKIRAAFQRVDGTWKLAPAGGTQDCTSAFDRVATPVP